MRPFRLLPATDEGKEAEPARKKPEITEITEQSSLSARQTGVLPGELPATPVVEGPVTPVLPSRPLSLRDLMPAPVHETAGKRRVLVIPAAAKSPGHSAPASDSSARHLNPHVRRVMPLVLVVLILGGTLLAWFPLSGGQSRFWSSPGFSHLQPFVPFVAWFQPLQGEQPTPTPSLSVAPANNSLPRSQYVAMAEQDAIDVGISPTYFVRQINLESGFNPNAVSPSGAVGIAQFMPATAAGLGIDPWNPVQALKAAAQMMANSYHTYGDYAKALAAYNAGSAALQGAVNRCGANWLSCMSPETQHYVAVIMAP